MSLNRVPLDEMDSDFRIKVNNGRKLGLDTRFLEIAANAPHMVNFYWGDFYEDIFFKGKVPVRIKELIRLHLSQLHGCEF
jgi:hypothetical protein